MNIVMFGYLGWSPYHDLGSMFCRIILNFGLCLCRSPIDQLLSEKDKLTIMKVLHFHPRRDEKFGSGPQDIKVCVFAWSWFGHVKICCFFMLMCCVHETETLQVSMFRKFSIFSLENIFLSLLTLERIPLKITLFCLLGYFITNIYTMLNLISLVGSRKWA